MNSEEEAEIRERLSKASKGPWKAVEGGSKVVRGCGRKAHHSRAEDDCILDDTDREIMGCSEWMRVEWTDLEFMAHARQDIETLLNQIDVLKGDEA